MRQGEDISRNELHLLVGHEPHSSAPDKLGIRSAADDASQLTVELLQLRGREGFSPLANFAWCAFMTSWSRKTAWTNSARLAGRPNRSHLTGGSTWASKAAGANFPTCECICTRACVYARNKPMSPRVLKRARKWKSSCVCMRM